MLKTKRNKARCTCETTGTIYALGSVEGDIKVKISFHADGKEYRFQEIVMYEIHASKIYRIGNIPVGGSRKRMLGDITPGTAVRVLYDPDNPKRAYLPDNDNGKHYNVEGPF